jgi:hypothetical protein
MNFLIIPEDPRYDRHILKPVVRAMLNRLGKPNATIEFPKGTLGGTGSALDWRSIESIIDQYEYLVDLFLLCVDRDGQEGRRDSLDHLEQRAREKLNVDGFGEICFLAVAAQQEIEVWALGGLDDLPTPTEYQWDDVRQAPNSKERYFAPHAEKRGVSEREFGGRKTLGEESAANYDALRQKCPELDELEQRVEQCLME